MQQRINSEIDNDESEHGPNLTILSAVYGRAEVTETAQKILSKGTTVFKAKNNVFGDSWVGTVKTLVITYLDGNAVKTKVC